MAMLDGDDWKCLREAGDCVLDRLLWDAGAALIPLIGGLLLVGRRLLSAHNPDALPREAGPAKS